MKTFKFFLASLFLMLCSVASAQQVVVTKTDGTVDTFQPNEVDSVVYKPATKYYYYAGWECPMNEGFDLASQGTVIENYEGLSSGTVIRDYAVDKLSHEDYETWYVVIPEKIGIWASAEPNGKEITNDYQDVKTKSIDGVNYIIITSDDPDFDISPIILKVR